MSHGTKQTAASTMCELTNAIFDVGATSPDAPATAPDPSDADGSVVTIPLMTKKGSRYVRSDLDNIHSGLFANIRVLAVGSPGDVGAQTFTTVATNADDATSGLTSGGYSVADDKGASKAGYTASAKTWRSDTQAATVDTGSWATVLPASWVEQYTGMTSDQIAGYQVGSLTYTSSDNTESGHWVPIKLGFPDATNPDGSMVTSTVTALVVDDSQPGTDGKVHRPFMLGSGIDAAFAIPTTGMQMTPDNEAFLNVDQMHDGTMAHSFAIDRHGIELGMTAADAQAQGGWATQQLAPSSIGTSPAWGVQDWQFPTFDVDVGGRTYKEVSTMVDTGIPGMFFEHTKTPQDTYDHAGDVMGVSMPADDGSSAAWTYTLPGGSAGAPAGADQDMAPTEYGEHGENDAGQWTADALLNVNTSYMNAGLNPLRHMDYLYDSDAGVFGLHDRKA